VAHSTDWLHLDSFHQCNMFNQCHKDPQDLEKQYCHGCRSMFWPLAEYQAMNTHFLSTLQWHTVLTGCTWIVSTNATCSTSATRILNTWRNSIATKASQCYGQLCWVKLLNTLSEPTGVAYNANWLYLDTFPSTQYAPPLPQGSSIPGKTVLP